MDTVSKKNEHISTELRVSNDRGKCTVTVSGDIKLCDVKKRCDEMKNPEDSDMITDSMVTSVPEGYSITVTGRKSLKNYLNETQTMTCIELFLFCRRLCRLFSKCNSRQLFNDFVFDYNTIYTDFGLEKAMFVYAPYSSGDSKKMTCGKLMELLYLYTSEEDIFEEQNIKEMIKLFFDWEKSGYGQNLFERLSSFVNSYISLIEDKQKNDIFSKGTATIKRLAENGSKQPRRIFSADRAKCCISFSPGPTKKRKQFVCAKNSLYQTTKTIKIGRNKLWADLHIPDMTVSGCHACVEYKEDNFYIRRIGKTGVTVLNGVKLAENDEVMILNGSTVSFGRSAYKIKISNHQNIG